MNNRKNREKSLVITLLSTLFLVVMPGLTQADYCADIKERYWRCARSSMTGEKCSASDNVSIPSECLTAGAASEGGGGSSSSGGGGGGGDSASKSAWSFFSHKKPPAHPIVSPEDTEIVLKKPVKIINIHPTNGKPYIETEEDVEQFTSKVRADLLEAIKDGKKVRLQFQ